MIISKEKWNTLTCKEVLDLIKEYNKTAPNELKFRFTNSDKWYLNNRLQHGSITFKCHKNNFDSNELAKDVFKHDLSFVDFMTIEEYADFMSAQNENAKFIQAGAIRYVNPYKVR